MRKLMTAAVITAAAVSVMLTSCGSWDGLLTIDGKAVPFTKGEDEISETLGDLFVKVDNFEYPEDADKEKAVLRKVVFDKETDTGDFTYESYDFNSKYCDLDKCDITFLGYDGVNISIEELERDYKDYIIHDGISDYSLYYADGDFVKFKNDDYYSEENESVFEELQSDTLNGNSDGFVMISMFKSDDNTAEDISFTVVTPNKK